MWVKATCGGACGTVLMQGSVPKKLQGNLLIPCMWTPWCFMCTWPSEHFNKALNVVLGSLDYEVVARLFWKVVVNADDGTKQNSSDLLSQLGFQILRLNYDCLCLPLLCTQRSRQFSFSNGTKYFTNQDLVSAQLGRTESSGSHCIQGPGITLLCLIGGCISLVAEVIPVHIAPQPVCLLSL